MTGTRTDVAARLRALTSSGITEVAYQPMGPDIPRELAAFAQAAGLDSARPTDATTIDTGTEGA
jgi:5,10-methylenetetrahydromethanopterin reductase